jgi:hypothetical protein
MPSRHQRGGHPVSGNTSHQNANPLLFDWDEFVRSAGNGYHGTLGSAECEYCRSWKRCLEELRSVSRRVIAVLFLWRASGPRSQTPPQPHPIQRRTKARQIRGDPECAGSQDSGLNTGPPCRVALPEARIPRPGRASWFSGNTDAVTTAARTTKRRKEIVV